MALKKKPSVDSFIAGANPNTMSIGDAKTPKRENVLTSKRPAAKTSQGGRPSVFEGEDRERLTIYLTPAVASALERARLTLREKVERSHRGKVSKSLLTEAALLLALNGLEAEGNKSALYDITLKLLNA